jgi:signal transduction histidine kinase
MLAALAGPRVHVSLELAGCPQGELFIPPIDLTRVLINLVRNAAEAMSIGGRVVIAATATVYKASTAVLISIEDNGPGIPLSLLDRIFDLQVANRSTEESSRPRMQFRPRGLGLRIVREFIEASGGTVRALRLPDRGSRFEVMLPMVTLMVTKGGATL